MGIVLTSISECCNKEESETKNGALKEELSNLKNQIVAVEAMLEKEDK